MQQLKNNSHSVAMWSIKNIFILNTFEILKKREAELTRCSRGWLQGLGLLGCSRCSLHGWGSETKTQNTLVWECRSLPLEVLEEVAGEREAWVWISDEWKKMDRWMLYSLSRTEVLDTNLELLGTFVWPCQLQSGADQMFSLMVIIFLVHEARRLWAFTRGGRRMGERVCVCVRSGSVCLITRIHQVLFWVWVCVCVFPAIILSHPPHTHTP